MASAPSLKQLQIDKAASNMVIAVSVATFILIFTLLSSNSLHKVMSYHNRVISAQSKAQNQLTADITASKRLISSYQKFNSSNPNLLGSQTTGSGQNVGSNAKIVLDALPSEYDEPALATSVQYLLSNQGVTINSLSSTDSSVTSTTAGGPVAIPISFDITGPYQNVENVITNLEKSILPFQFQQVTLSGDQSDLTLTATVQTYYRPATSFNITKETIN